MRFLDIREAAAELRMTPAGVRQAIHRGELRPDGRGGKRIALFYPETIEAFARVRDGRAPKRSPHRSGAASKPGDVVYFVRCDVTGLVKIGTTSGDEGARLSHLQVGSPTPLLWMGSVFGGANLERRLHERWAKRRSHGEWFRFSKDEAFAELARLRKEHGTRADAVWALMRGAQR